MAKNARQIAERRQLDQLGGHLLICADGSCAARSQGRKALKAARREIRALGRQRGAGRILCSEVACLGICRSGPIAVLWPSGTFYRRATEKNVRRIVREHAAEGRVVQSLCIAHPEGGSEGGTEAGS